MNYTKELLDGKKVKFQITLDKEEWNKELEHAYEHTKAKYKVQGFRPGKAPRKVIEQAYGKYVFVDEALNNSFYKYYNEVLDKESELEIVGEPRIDVKKVDDDGVILEIENDLKPEVKLGAYTNLGIEKETAKVSAQEVNNELKAMQEKSARLVEVDRKIKKGDTVKFDFTGKLNGVAFDGGSAKDFELEIGSGQFVPGFEDQMVGIKKGETKDLKITFPEDYSAKELAGKETIFEVTIHEIREKQLPELDDEFAKNVSEFDTLEEYKKDLKKHLLEDKKKQIENNYEDKLIETVVNNAEVEIPESMINEQVDMFIHDFEHRLAHQGLKFEDYLKFTGSNMEDFKKSKKDDAKQAVKSRLVLEEIVKKEKLTAEKDEIEAKIAEIAKNTGKEVDEFKKTLDEHKLNHIVNDIVIDKILKVIKK